MDLSWSDLNNVQDAGDYPFRDGKITITFAEIATWKNNPDAQFQLMRKHPIRAELYYVLGKQIEEKLAPQATELIYGSSNGDSWWLTRDHVTGAPAVMHRPNSQSGGQVSCIEIENFLSEGAGGPEHQALRRLLERSTSIATLLIACDIHSPKSESFKDLASVIQSLGAWWHHLETIWIVRCAYTPDEVRDKLKLHIGSDDQLLVIDISRDTAAWVGINDAGNKWLNTMNDAPANPWREGGQESSPL